VRRAAAVAGALCLLLAAPGAARAGFLPARAVDGPSADIVGPGDVALALDGAGAVTYLKLDGGVAHVFVSTLRRGVPSGAPVEVDSGGPGAPSSDPRIATGNGGRVLVTWLNQGNLYASLRASASAAFSPPVLAYAPASGTLSGNALSMGVNGKAFAGFSTSDGDVRAAYMAPDGSWTAASTPLDADPAQNASGAAVAASADGTALYAWTETGTDGLTHVFARRLFGARPSTVAPEASVASLDGRPGGNADSATVGIEYDSSHAWVAFRQEFTDGGAVVSRGLGRMLLASAFDKPPLPIDGLGFGVGASATQPRLAFTGRGRGTFAAALQGPAGVSGTLLKNDVLGKPTRFSTGTSLAESYPAPTASENNTGTISWQRDPGPGGARLIVARHLPAVASEPPEATLSAPPLGAVDASTGLFSSADAGGDAAITFAQGDAGARAVVVALYDAPPGAPHAHDERNWRRDTRPRFHWSAVTDTWSTRVTYALQIDRKTVGTFTGTPVWTPPRPIPDGDHRWRLVTTDGRGQQTISHDRFLRIDTHKPRVRVLTRRAGGSAVAFTVVVDDGPAGSGAGRITIAFGDGTHGAAPPATGRVTHRYRGAGSYAVVVTARDKAGNESTARGRAKAG
jgi:hypothetical protein